MLTVRMDSFPHPKYQASQNVKAPTTAPSTEEESLLVDNYDVAHRPPSNESTDLSSANSPYGSDKPGGHWNMQPTAPIQYAGGPLAHRVRPMHTTMPWPPQDDSQYANGQSMPLMSTEGSFLPPQPYQDAVSDGDDFETLGEINEDNRPSNMPFASSTPVPTYDYGTNVPQFGSAGQQLPTPYPSSPNTLERSGSGNKRKRLGEDQWQAVDSANNTPHSLMNPTLHVGQTLTRAGEQILAIWLQAHQRMPNSSELLGLSVVTEVVEPAVTYWLSCNRSPPFPVLPTQPVPPSSGSSSNNAPTTPTPTANSTKNTCNVKKRVPKPWNKAWDNEKPYSCLCKCGWTFTKKGDWIKHEKINFPEYTFHCPIPDCRSSFGRKDKCRDHIRKVHKIIQTQQFDLDSRRTSVLNGLNDRCGFCGHICTSWQEWYDHVGLHFENRVEGGPWTMSMWRYPWIDDAEAGHGDERPDDGNDPDNGGNDDSEKDAEHETDDSSDGHGARDPSHGSKRGGGDSGGRQSRFGGGRSGVQHMVAKYCTRSSQPPAPSALTEALKAASRTNSMPHLNQKRPRRRTKKSKEQDQLKMNHPITWPLTEEQTIPKVAPGSSMRTERINPLVDLAVAGKSVRDAHIAELAPYLEDKAHVVSQSSLLAKPDEAPTQAADLPVMNVSSHMDGDFDDVDRQENQGVLDRIDDLIHQSAGEGVELPQLVVCGDQSSGKSSVLEAITSIPFPRNDIQGGRFATKVIPKPTEGHSLLPIISPGADRSLSRCVSNEDAQVSVQRCSSCDKEFKRPCDLTKHEKIHSRPWKCDDEECKYHALGWPTEKERDRNMNDKHSKAPALYKCLKGKLPRRKQVERDVNLNPTIEFFAAVDHPQIVTSLERDGLKTHDTWTKSPHWRVCTASQLLSTLEVGSDLVVNQKHRTEKKDSRFNPQKRTSLGLQDSGMDSNVTSNSENVQMINNLRLTGADEFHLESTGIEVDNTSLSSLIVNFRNLMDQDRNRNSLYTHQSIAILNTMIKDARRFFLWGAKCSRARSLRSRSLRSSFSNVVVATTADCSIWQTIRATSAAPTYFQPVKINGQPFFDGGLKSNNPFSFDLGQTRESKDEPANLTAEPPGDYFGYLYPSGLPTVGTKRTPRSDRSLSRNVDIWSFGCVLRAGLTFAVAAGGWKISADDNFNIHPRLGHGEATSDAKGLIKWIRMLRKEVHNRPTAFDMEWLKQMGIAPGALEVIGHAAHSLNKLRSSTRGLLYLLAFLDPQKLSRYLMECASLSNWPQCFTDASNQGVYEMLLRLINESLDRYARGVAGGLKDHIITIDSIDNVKSKIPTIYSSRQVRTTELQMAAYPLVDDRRIIISSGAMTFMVPDIETGSKVTEFADPLGSLAIHFATSGDLNRFKTVISRGFHLTSQSSQRQHASDLKSLQLSDTQSLEDLHEQDRSKTGNQKLESGNKEELVSSPSEPENPAVTGSPVGRVLDVSETRSSLSRTGEGRELDFDDLLSGFLR